MSYSLFIFVGFGVRANKDLESKTFVAEYRGELLSHDEGERRYATSDEMQPQSYLYFFKHKKRKLW